jgi:3D (Asp-Asp-Asp) domain-containing protein
LRDVDRIGTQVDGARRMTMLATELEPTVRLMALGWWPEARHTQPTQAPTLSKGSQLLLQRFLMLPAVLALAVVCWLPATVTFADTTLQAGQTVVVVGTDGRGLKLRVGPGMGHRIVATVQEGASVQVVAGPVSDGTDDWYQLSVGTPTGTSTTGWGIASYLLPTSAVRSLSTDEGGARIFLAKVTAYSDGLGGVPIGARTYSGTKTRWGVVAVDPKVIPIGSALRIEGYDDVIFIAEDVGGGIRGESLDIWLPDQAAAKTYGTQYRRITVLREGPDRGPASTVSSPASAPTTSTTTTSPASGIPSAPTLIP